MAISQLYANYNTKALANLIYLNNLSDFEFKDEAAYYLALTYIKTNKTLDARKVLQNLKNQDSEYADRAKQILSEMRWF
jgi:thioredoxin-like negative regulator of GroEL